MSSPDPEHGGAAEERTLTIIVVPHGDLETRSFVVSYAKLKLAVIAGATLLVGFALVIAFWFPIASQAARVPGLVRELEELSAERARVAELARTLQEVEAQYERVRQMLGADAPVQGETAPMLPPLRNDTGASRTGGPPAAGAAGGPDEQHSAAIDLWPLAIPGFITRSLSDAGSRHPGLDIAVARNTYIRAAGAGVVRAAGIDEVYGYFVILEHGGGLETVYGHASKIFVTAGDRVGRGEVIALTGSTGRSSAPHLHFEVREGGKPVDPLLYVRQR
jgi:murein DD-endopeptidase MepM/ murein hydrolase activator NlpD